MNNLSQDTDAVLPVGSGPVGPPKTALVLCGGGSRGAAEVGFYQALSEYGISVDMIVGTSVGAVNGAFMAAGLAPEDLKRLWREFKHWRPYQVNWEILWKWRKAKSLLDPRGFQRFLEDNLPVKKFEDLNIPLTVVATDLQTAEPVYFEKGDLVFAVMASTAMPLYFPPLRCNGHQIVDGGVTNNVPIDVAVAKGATKVYAMLCGCQEELERPVHGLFNIESRAFNIAMLQKLHRDLQGLRDRAELVILEPCLTSAKNVLDFSQTGKIIEEGYFYALSLLSRETGTRNCC